MEPVNLHQHAYQQPISSPASVNSYVSPPTTPGSYPGSVPMMVERQSTISTHHSHNNRSYPHPHCSSDMPHVPTVPPVDIKLRFLEQKCWEQEEKINQLLQVSSQLEQVLARMDLLEGKVNMVRSTVEEHQLILNSNNSATIGYRNASASDAPTPSDWDGESFMDVTSALTTIIKQEKPDEVLYDGNIDEMGDGNWNPLDDEDEEEEYRPNKKTKSGRPVGRPKRYDGALEHPKPLIIKKKNSGFYEAAVKGEDGRSLAENALPRKFIIKPNLELIQKSKQLLGKIQPDPLTGKFGCPDCEKFFSHKKDLIRHHYIHSGLKPYQCTSCEASFARGDKLTRHIMAMHVDKKFQIPSISTKKKSAGKEEEGGLAVIPGEGESPKIKIDSKRGTSSHSCADCGKVFRRPRDLNRHAASHLPLWERATYTCDVCGKNYTRNDALRLHQRKAHSDESSSKNVDAIVQIERKRAAVKNHVCPEENCGKAFSSKYKLEIHISACRGLKPFSCNQCGNTFTQKVGLTQHIAAVHNNIKRFLCNECGKGFYGSASYQRHLRMHRGIKPYKCKFCDRRFTGRSDVIRHEMIHNGIRKVKCTLCDLKFYRPYTLKRHMLVHTGEKPFVCDECGARFSQNGSLNKHKQSRGCGFNRAAGQLQGNIRGERKMRAEAKPRESRLLRELERKEQSVVGSERSSALSATMRGELQLLQAPSPEELKNIVIPHLNLPQAVSNLGVDQQIRLQNQPGPSTTASSEYMSNLALYTQAHRFGGF